MLLKVSNSIMIRAIKAAIIGGHGGELFLTFVAASCKVIDALYGSGFHKDR